MQSGKGQAFRNGISVNAPMVPIGKIDDQMIPNDNI